MPSTLDLRRRIRSVKSTQQITRAMKMVAAARLRRAQQRIVEARPYGNALKDVLQSVAARVSTEHFPLLEEREEKRAILLVISSDKGLAGAFNSNVLREASSLVLGHRWEDAQLVLVGRKGVDFFRHRGITPLLTHANLLNTITPEAAGRVAADLAERFKRRETDAIYVLSNRFRSIIQQKVVLTRLLPIRRSEIAGVQKETDYIFEPTPGAILDQLLPRYVEFEVLRALLSSQAAEHAARMTAMDAATKNAGEMIDHLTLTYNRVRQASITKELIEIVSGAQALGER